MTQQAQSYLVPSGFGEALLVEKRSRFIARVWRVETESDALSHIREMREKHWDAAHNVYAYIIRGGQTRYSDDGEPQGTSGMPTLNVFKGREIFNVCCVVTRYFGGVLLGAGGLVRAYAAAAKMALENAGVDMMRQWRVVLLACPYGLYEQIRNLLRSHGCVVENADFGVDVVLEALVPVEAVDACSEALLEASAGAVRLEIVDTVFKSASISS